MSKKIFLILVMACFAVISKAQTADKVYEQYADFSMATLDNNINKALHIGETILPNADLLPAKTRTSFYNGLAKMYESAQFPDKAMHYYEIVTAAAPDYYVAHRALGYLYLTDVNNLLKKINATNDRVVRDKIVIAYKNAIRKVLPQLEKAQACGPDEHTLHIIKTLYNNLDDNQALNTLTTRLNTLSKNCEDVLPNN